MSPFYDFKCPSGHTHERLVPNMAVTHDAEPCPECGQEAIRQLPLPAKPVIKGGTPLHHPQKGKH